MSNPTGSPIEAGEPEPVAEEPSTQKDVSVEDLAKELGISVEPND